MCWYLKTKTLKLFSIRYMSGHWYLYLSSWPLITFTLSFSCMLHHKLGVAIVPQSLRP